MISIQYLFDNLAAVLDKIKKSNHLYLFLDYDGTLVGIKKKPEDAKPSKRTKSLITKLLKNPHITVILVSGRPVSQLINFFKDCEINRLHMVGSHGAEIKIDGQKIQIIKAARQNLSHIGFIKQKLVEIIGPKSCYTIEDKKVSVAIHYRNCPPEDMFKLREVKSFLNQNTQNRNLDIIEGKKVIEVKASSINKGMALKDLLKTWNNSKSGFSLCIGDDVTDEYMFEANQKGLNIKVAKSKDTKSCAHYFITGIGEVQQFLNQVNQAFP